MSENPSTTSAPLLSTPESREDTTATSNVQVSAEALVKFDSLGPMVVNSDGTLSRIANWENMTEAERERTMRVLVARNRARLAKQQKDSSDTSSTLLSQAAASSAVA